METSHDELEENRLPPEVVESCLNHGKPITAEVEELHGIQPSVLGSNVQQSRLLRSVGRVLHAIREQREKRLLEQLEMLERDRDEMQAERDELQNMLHAELQSRSVVPELDLGAVLECPPGTGRRASTSRGTARSGTARSGRRASTSRSSRTGKLQTPLVSPHSPREITAWRDLITSLPHDTQIKVTLALTFSF